MVHSQDEMNGDNMNIRKIIIVILVISTISFAYFLIDSKQRVVRYEQTIQNLHNQIDELNSSNRLCSDSLKLVLDKYREQQAIANKNMEELLLLKSP